LYLVTSRKTVLIFLYLYLQLYTIDVHEYTDVAYSSATNAYSSISYRCMYVHYFKSNVDSNVSSQISVNVDYLGKTMLFLSDLKLIDYSPTVIADLL